MKNVLIIKHYINLSSLPITIIYHVYRCIVQCSQKNS
jgi:hypothetical protein